MHADEQPPVGRAAQRKERGEAARKGGLLCLGSEIVKWEGHALIEVTCFWGV